MKKFTSFAAALLSVAASLVAQKVSVEFDAGTDFSAFKTYTLREVKLTSANPALNSDLVKKAITAELEKALAAKRLTPLPANADVEVLAEFGAETKESIEVVRGGGRGTGPQTIKTEVTTATLTVDFRAGAAKALVWRSVTVDQQNNPAKFSGRYDDIMKKAFEKYPPKK